MLASRLPPAVFVRTSSELPAAHVPAVVPTAAFSPCPRLPARLPAVPSSVQPSPAAGSLGLPPGMEAPGGGKKGHRRHRSISSMLLPGWRRKGSASGAAGGCLQSRLSLLLVGRVLCQERLCHLMAAAAAVLLLLMDHSPPHPFPLPPCPGRSRQRG